MFGVYVHIPYCAAKCRYCDFYSRAASHGVPQEYIRAVLREAARFAPECGVPLRPDTVFFGGGTPSLLTPAQAAQIIDALCPVPGAEITLEANPETVTPDTLRGFLHAGVNRISFGAQTADDDSLRRLGRRHTAQQARQALAWAREAGFTNISGDMMLALPQYTPREAADTVRLLTEGGCTHISAYMLKIEPNTVFGKNPPQGVPCDDDAADYYLQAAELLRQNGYEQYEISNFAKPGYACRHNLIYWQRGDYLGIGPAAHSCMHGRRFSTPCRTDAFIRADAVYEPQGEVTAEDMIMLQLRLAEGLDADALAREWGVHFTVRHQQWINALVKRGCALWDGHTLRLTPQGMLLHDAVVLELIS